MSCPHKCLKMVIGPLLNVHSFNSRFVRNNFGLWDCGKRSAGLVLLVVVSEEKRLGTSGLK